MEAVCCLSESLARLAEAALNGNLRRGVNPYEKIAAYRGAVDSARRAYLDEPPKADDNEWYEQVNAGLRLVEKAERACDSNDRRTANGGDGSR